MEQRGRIIEDTTGNKWMALQSFENGAYFYRAANITTGLLSEAKGVTIAELVKEIEAIEETTLFFTGV